jgi:hypothetical protein
MSNGTPRRAVFNQPFFQLLDSRDQNLHLTALMLVAFAVAFLMGPAAYHRQAEPQAISRRFVRYASHLLMLALLPLMVAVSIDVYLIAHAILHQEMPAAELGGAVLLVFAIVWFVIPQLSVHSRASH